MGFIVTFSHMLPSFGEKNRTVLISLSLSVGTNTGCTYHSSSLDCEAEALTPSNAGSHKQVVMTRWLWRLKRIVAISLELESLAVPIVYT